jgi:hypothetical protein
MIASSLSPRGACYGYDVYSDLPLNYLRSGGGERLEVVAGIQPDQPPGELLREWEPPYFPIHARLYRDGSGYRLWNHDAGWFKIEPHLPRITVPPGGNPVRTEERVWGLPVMLCFLERGDLPIHASCVEIDGRALLLAAPKKYGKTTLAAAFASAGYRVLAEDLVCLRHGSPPVVVPGPAMLRIRRDLADAFTVAGAVELGRDEDRLHLSLGLNRGTSDPIPLGGIAILTEGDTDPRVEALGAADAVADLWYLSFKLHNDEDLQRCFEGVTRLAFAARIWTLTRRLRLEELAPTVERLVDAMRSHPETGMNP